MMAKYRNYTEKDFISAIQNSWSWAQVLKKLNLQIAGGNYSLAKNRAKQLDIDVSHFTGQGHLKGKKHNWSPKKALSEILVKDSTYTNSTHLRNRLVKEGVLKNECYECGLTEWGKEPLTLELDHKNGGSRDNRVKNLRLLCPNCHSQTPTWRRRK